MTRHFLTLFDFSAAELRQVLRRAQEMKTALRSGELRTPLRHKTMAMIFEKSSTRTRVSFEAGMAQLGGASLFLSPRDTHLDRGEPVEDTARVMSRMVDVIVIRANSHEMVERFAKNSRVPVINALTDRHHPASCWLTSRPGSSARQHRRPHRRLGRRRQQRLSLVDGGGGAVRLSPEYRHAQGLQTGQGPAQDLRHACHADA